MSWFGQVASGKQLHCVQVKSVNRTPVKNLAGLVAAVEGCKDHFLRFQLEYNQVRIG